MRARHQAGDSPVPASTRRDAAADPWSDRTGRHGDAAFPAPSRGHSSRYSRRVPGRAADTGTPGHRRVSRTARSGTARGGTAGSGTSLLVAARGVGRE